RPPAVRAAPRETEARPAERAASSPATAATPTAPASPPAPAPATSDGAGSGSAPPPAKVEWKPTLLLPTDGSAAKAHK
ncbi:MAG TPA: hypothetical protein VGD80_31755, partial [Kofleriaceae bacterium]